MIRRAALTAAALVVMLYACASPASGHAVSVVLYNATGGIGCHAVPTATGLRTAGHCVKGPTVTIAGTAYPASVDPLRDLGHILAPLYAAEAHERIPFVGEAVEWRNTRGTGGGSVYAVWYAEGKGAEGGTVKATPDGPTWYPVTVICHDHGRRVIPGDSGSGVFAAGGELVGIVTRASLDESTDALGPCGGEQFVVAVEVP